MCPSELSYANDDFQFILYDSDASVFYDLFLGGQFPIQPCTTMINIINERELQYECEYLFTHFVIFQYQ